MAFNLKTFYTRATSALVFVALLLGCVWYSYYSFVAFFTLVGFIGLYEFYKISEKLGVNPYKIISYLLYAILYGIIIYLFSGSERINPHLVAPLLSIFGGVSLLFSFTLFIIELFKKEGNLNNVAYTILSFLYVAVPCFLLTILVGALGKFQPHKVIGMIFFVWINDTGAYLVGSFMGRHKLYERISPNKTWEGTMGGIAFCISLSYVVYLIFPQLAFVHWLIISIIVAVFGTLGDLIESMLKRIAGVKDSGNMIPGHGGVLDRFDSLFFATPFLFCYLTLMGLL